MADKLWCRHCCGKGESCGQPCEACNTASLLGTVYVPGLPEKEFIKTQGSSVDDLTIREVDILRIESLGDRYWICAYVGDRRYVLVGKDIRFDYWEDDEGGFAI